MKLNKLLWTAIVSSIVFASLNSEAGRIRMRKVKDAPKVCSHMEEDKLLSRGNKRIFGTLRNSVIIEQDVALVDDLGKKVCLWPSNKFQVLGDLTKYSFYIDEQRNALYPYMKSDANYQVIKISLDDCSIGEIQTTDKLELPKCESKKKSRGRSKRKVASHRANS